MLSFPALSFLLRTPTNHTLSPDGLTFQARCLTLGFLLNVKPPRRQISRPYSSGHVIEVCRIFKRSRPQIVLLWSQNLENCQQMHRARCVCRERGPAKPGRTWEQPSTVKRARRREAGGNGASSQSFLLYRQSTPASQTAGAFVWGCRRCANHLPTPRGMCL